MATESSSSPQYLYDVIHQDDGAPVLLIDKISENTEEDNKIIDNIALKEALKNLDIKSRQIIILRYFKDKTQIEVAKQLGISQVQVSRIEKKVLKLMKRKTYCIKHMYISYGFYFCYKIIFFQIYFSGKKGKLNNIFSVNF